MRQLLVLLACMVCCLPDAAAQKFHVSNYTRAHGLPSDQVRSIAVDTFGFLWLATDDGLVRYDGRQFRSFATALPSRYGRHLLPVDEGLLYSHDAGLSLIRPALDTAHFEMLIEGAIMAASDKLYYPNRLFRRADGSIWISQPNGRVARWEAGSVQQYALDTIARNARSDAAISFAETPSGRLWAATSSGKIYLFEPDQNNFAYKHGTHSVTSMLFHQGALWIGGQKLERFSLSEESDRILRIDQYEMSDGYITAMTPDDIGRLYIGLADRGLFLLETPIKNTPELRPVFSNNDPHRVDPLPFRKIHALYSYSPQELWIASAQGLGILRKRFFESVDGLPNGTTMSLTGGGDNTMYVSFGDVHQIDQGLFGFTAQPLALPRRATVTALGVTNGSLWMGTADGHLLARMADGRIHRDIDLSKRGEGIFFVSADRQGRLWFCQAPTDQPIIGVGCLQADGQVKLYGAPEGLKDRILVVRQSRRGRIYAAGIGATTYLYRYRPEEDAFLNLSLPFDFPVSPNFEVHDLTIDTEERVWLATTDGLLLYDLDHVRRIDLGEGRSDIEVRAVVDMPDGAIWLSTDTEGIWQYRDGDVLSLREESGLPAKIMAYRSLWLDQRQRLWAGTAEGMVYTYHDKAQLSAGSQVRLLGISTEGRPLSPERPLLSNRQEMTVRWVAPARHGYGQVVSYRLDEGEWQRAKPDRVLRVGPFTAGQHQLYVRVRNEGGFDWSGPLVIPFLVRPPWYEQRFWQWVLVLLVVTVVGWLLLGINRRYRKRLRRLATELRRREKESAQQAVNLHELERVHLQEQSEARVNGLGLELLRRFFQRVGPGADEEAILQALTHYLLRYPHVTHFELGRRRGDTLQVETCLREGVGFERYTRRYDPHNCLLSRTIEAGQGIRAVGPATSSSAAAARNTRTLSAGIGMPFLWSKEQEAVLFLYTDQPEHLDTNNLKMLGVLVAYLEQIT